MVRNIEWTQSNIEEVIINTQRDNCCKMNTPTMYLMETSDKSTFSDNYALIVQFQNTIIIHSD